MNFEKFTVKEGAGNYLHCKRQRGELFQYGNRSIDPSRTHLNSKVEFLQKSKEEPRVYFSEDYYETMKRFLDESKRITGRTVSKKAKCVVGVVVTLPAQYGPPEGVEFEEWYTKERRQKENYFYYKTNLFLFDKFGINDEKLGSNFLCSAVHRDETTSHSHTLFIPVVKESCRYEKTYTKNGQQEHRTVTVRKGSISACEVVNQSVLRGLHEELDAYLRKEISWYKGGILLSPDERMMPGQNLKTKDLKKSGKEYAKLRAQENRIVIMAAAPQVFDTAFETLRAEGKDKDDMVSYIQLVSHLVADGKLTEEDCKNNTVYQDAFIRLKSFRAKIKAQKEVLCNSVKGQENMRSI